MIYISKNINCVTPRLSYLIVIIIFLAIAGAGIHRKAYSSVAPPIYDPISYYTKSHLVWEALAQRDFKQVMNAFPIRPPATAFILYPTGFHYSIKSFLFRAAFAPILIFGIALIAILLPLVRNIRDAWIASGLTLGLMSMPLLYHFEWCDEFINYYHGCKFQWGMVDALEGSVAALAIAFIHSGIRRGSKALCTLCWIAAACSFFIKPSGVLVILCLFLIGSVEFFLEWRRKIYGRRAVIRLALFTALCGIITLGASLTLALSTEYLGKETVINAIQASKILCGMQSRPIIYYLKNIVRPEIGVWIFIPIVLTVFFICISIFITLYRRNLSDLTIRSAAALAIITASLYWWKCMAGADSRYLYPFIFLIIAWFLPVVFSYLSLRSGWLTALVSSYMALPAVAMAFLLSSGNDNKDLQKIIGCNLTTGQYGEEVRIGEQFVREANNKKRQIRLYNVMGGNGHGAGVIEMVGQIEAIDRNEAVPKFQINRVNDWNHPGIKIKELIASDYILKNEDHTINNVANNRVAGWEEEEMALGKFIEKTARNESHGLIKITKSTTQVYQVTDAACLALACKEWVKSKLWDDDFYERNSIENGDFDPPGLKMLSIETVQREISIHGSSVGVVDFGNVVQLLGMSEKPLSSRTKNYTFYFKALNNIPQRYYFFVHLINASHEIQFQHDFLINPSDGEISKGAIWKSIVKIPRSEISSSDYLAFGVYNPSTGVTLVSDGKESDWGGRRVFVPLKK